MAELQVLQLLLFTALIQKEKNDKKQMLNEELENRF